MADGFPAVYLTSAGIDKIGSEKVMLLPQNPDESAKKIGAKIFSEFGVNVGVVITYSDGRQDKAGATQIAVGVYGVPALRESYYGSKKMQETICSMLAATGGLIMGQSGTGKPVVIIRGLDYEFNSDEAQKFLPEYSQGEPYSNDTAAMISWYPLTECESLALHIEGWFYTENNGLPRPKFQELGQYIKIMIARKDKHISAAAAIPFMSQKFHSVDEYCERLEILRRELAEHISSSYPDSNIVLHVN